MGQRMKDQRTWWRAMYEDISINLAEITVPDFEYPSNILDEDNWDCIYEALWAEREKL